MSTENDVARSLRSWLREDRYEDADRVLDAVFDQVPTTPQRRASWLARRFPVMNSNFARLGVAAAVVVLAVIIGINFLPGSNPPGGPDVSPSPSEAAPSPTPADFSAQEGGGTALAPGSYVITYLSPARITVTVPAGWSKGYLDWALFSSKATVSLAFMTVDNLYVDPCAADPRLREPAVGPTVDDLAAALGDVPGLQATAPSDVTVAGFTGKQVDLTASETWCGGAAKMWETSGGVDSPAGGPMRLWILDIDGTRLVLSFLDFDGVSSARLAEVQAIVDSIQIEP